MNCPRASIAFCLFFVCASAQGVMQGKDDYPWGCTIDSEWDKPVMAKYPNGNWFLNLGPTGIRAKINPETPKQLLVMFVFQDNKSPAAGKINIGDVIVGANGKKFATEHKFGRRGDKQGWSGPLLELAYAMEDSQGDDGKLDLMIIPKKGGSQTTVTLKLKKVGRFSPTWPYDCDRSNRLYIQLCEYLMADRKWGRGMAPHEKAHALLALMASGEQRYLSVVKDIMERKKNGRHSPDATNFASWFWGFESIVIGEWYLLTRDAGFHEAMKSLVVATGLGQDPRNGGYSHRPFPYIRKRVAGGGSPGYGPMAGPGGLNFLGMSLFKAGGFPIHELAYERYHQAYLRTAGPRQDAAVVYGFKAQPYCFVEVKNGSEVKSDRGVGYLCQRGMKGVKYNVPKNEGENTWIWKNEEKLAREGG